MKKRGSIICYYSGWLSKPYTFGMDIQDEDRNAFFVATLPLESNQLLISRAATMVKGKLVRKLLFIDAKKAHLNPKCKEDVCIQLPDEAGGGPGTGS